MDWWAIQEIMITLAVIVGVLVPVFALSYRFILKPVWKDRKGLASQIDSQTEALRDVRLDNMERQLEDLEASMRRLADASEFDRQLKSGKPPSDMG